MRWTRRYGCLHQCRAGEAAVAKPGLTVDGCDGLFQASARYCWWDFGHQIQLVRALLDLDVAWLLPGHGHRHAFALGEWRAALEQTLAWVER